LAKCETQALRGGKSVEGVGTQRLSAHLEMLSPDKKGGKSFEKTPKTRPRRSCRCPVARARPSPFRSPSSPKMLARDDGIRIPRLRPRGSTWATPGRSTRRRYREQMCAARAREQGGGGKKRCAGSSGSSFGLNELMQVTPFPLLRGARVFLCREWKLSSSSSVVLVALKHVRPASFVAPCKQRSPLLSSSTP